MIMLPEIKHNVDLAQLTTMKTGGPAEYFAVAKSQEELMELVRAANQKGWPVTVLGGGSNVLVNDRGVAGLVVKNEIKGVIEVEKDEKTETILIEVGAGEDWDQFVLRTVQEGWWGLENLSAIPGTVGATPIQNVGAYGVEVSNLIEKVKVYSASKDALLEMDNSACRFGYRDSFFKSSAGKDLIVVSVTFKLGLEPNPILHYKDIGTYFEDKKNPTQAEIRQAVIEIRTNKFPDWREVGTAGSFFKNPIVSVEEGERLKGVYPDLPTYKEADGRIKVSLGWLLDKVCGFKGVRSGNVGTYEKQSLVLVNYGGSSTHDILDFAERIAAEVKSKTGINIEREPVLI